MKLFLRRTAVFPGQAMYGFLTVPGLDKPLATVERPWVKNPKRIGGMSNISCVPNGKYYLSTWESKKFPRAIALENKRLGVTKYDDGFRFAILIHPANLARELAGCIAVGTAHGMVRGELGVINSRRAFDMLWERWIEKGQEGELSIMWAKGVAQEDVSDPYRLPPR